MRDQNKNRKEAKPARATKLAVYLLVLFFCFAFIAGAALPSLRKTGEPPASNAAEQASVGIGGNDYGEVAESAANGAQNVEDTVTFSTVAETNLIGQDSRWDGSPFGLPVGEARFRGPDNSASYPSSTNQGLANWYTNWQQTTASGTKEVQCTIIVKVNFSDNLKIAMQKGYVKTMKVTSYYQIHTYTNKPTNVGYNRYADYSPTRITGNTLAPAGYMGNHVTTNTGGIL